LDISSDSVVNHGRGKWVVEQRSSDVLSDTFVNTRSGKCVGIRMPRWYVDVNKRKRGWWVVKEMDCTWLVSKLKSYWC
jgi:hypothetical protein